METAYYTVEIHYCQGCGRQVFNRSADWRTKPAEDNYCKDCCITLRPAQDRRQIKDGRHGWVTTPVYDPMKELRLELDRMEKRLAKAEVQ